MAAVAPQRDGSDRSTLSWTFPGLAAGVGQLEQFEFSHRLALKKLICLSLCYNWASACHQHNHQKCHHWEHKLRVLRFLLSAWIVSSPSTSISSSSESPAVSFSCWLGNPGRTRVVASVSRWRRTSPQHKPRTESCSSTGNIFDKFIQQTKRFIKSSLQGQNWSTKKCGK